MELIDYVRMLRRQWEWVLGLALVGSAAGLLYALMVPPSYQATSEMFVRSVPATQSSEAARSASQFTLDRMQTYAELVDTVGVARGVIDALDLEMNPDQFAGSVSASVPPDTFILYITAESSDPGTAATIANATATRLGLAIEDLERVSYGGKSPVDLTVSRPATAPGSPASPNRNLAITLGLLTGVGLGLLIASLREQARTHGLRMAVEQLRGGDLGQHREPLSPARERAVLADEHEQLLRRSRT